MPADDDSRASKARSGNPPSYVNKDTSSPYGSLKKKVKSTAVSNAMVDRIKHMDKLEVTKRRVY
jgi:hypothetical protein